MAENEAPKMQATLGLTGLTMNAMALIAPGAFLWLTYFIQATTGVTGPAMWAGIVLALLLCLATAVCYAEMAKLYPGTGSSYYFAEQSFLNHDKAWKYARLSKFIVGWGSHLYYWIYPGVMVGVMGVLCGYLAGTLWPNFMSASNPGPVFMALIAVVFSFAVAWIANRGRGENELRIGPIESGHTFQPPQYVRHVRAEHAPIGVHFIDDYEFQVAKKLRPIGVMRQNAGVEHIGVGKDDVRIFADGGAVALRCIPIVNGSRD